MLIFFVQHVKKHNLTKRTFVYYKDIRIVQLLFYHVSQSLRAIFTKIYFQSMEATKALLRHSLRKKLDAALESETYLLIQHWCSADCQNAIKAYIDGKIQ